MAVVAAKSGRGEQRACSFGVAAGILDVTHSHVSVRPRSMVGGDLHWIWKPYALYQEVDYVRSVSISAAAV